MLSALETKNKVTGVKQSMKAIREDRAQRVYLAQDAAPSILSPVEEACRAAGVETVPVESMAVLGRTCGIDVGAAVAVVLKDSGEQP